MEAGNAVKAIFGTRAGNLKTDMDDFLKKAGNEAKLGERDLAALTPKETTVASSQERRPDATAAEVEQLENILGGSENIQSVAPAAKTRLLVSLKDPGLVRAGEAERERLTLYIPERGNTVHVLVGLYPERWHALWEQEPAGV